MAAVLGCVWEVCDLTSMRKRLELRDRKNKQFSPWPGKRLLRLQQPSLVGAVSFQVLQLKSQKSLVGEGWDVEAPAGFRAELSLGKSWHQLGGWQRAKPSSAAVTQ